MQALLSFDQAPPFSAPLRFFLTAPLFGGLAGFLLLGEGPALFASRWSPSVLAMTHLLVLGFMLQVMLGALVQILPVVAGANIRRPAMVAMVVHGLLAGGTLGLAAGFFFVQPGLLQAGAVLLGLAGMVFLLACARALLPVPSSSPTIRGLKLALLGLSGVLALGLFLVWALRQGTAFSLLSLTDLHAGWGLGAWSAVLLVAVAYVVVPMFQLTPGYPARAAWWFPVVIAGLCLLWGMAVFAQAESVMRLAKGLLALAGMGFCGLTWRLQMQRRRARVDATTRYWQLGLISSFFALWMMLTAAGWPALAGAEAWPFFFATLLLGGFFSFIIGMLYKIVPFLAWLHLQNRGRGKVLAPTMNKLLADSEQFRQFYIYLVGLGLLLLAPLWPEGLARPAALGLILSMGWLALNMFRVVRRYRQSAGEIDLKLLAP